MGTIAKNSFYSSITLGLRFLSNALLFIIIARVLGAEEFGKFSLAVSFAGIFLVVVDYGFNLLIAKEVATSPDKTIQISNAIISCKIVLAVISSIAIFLLVELLGYDLDTRVLIYILWLSALFYSFSVFLNAIFKGLNLFNYETYPTILLNGIQLVLVVILLLLDYKSLPIAIAYLVSRIVYFLASLYLVRKKIGRLSITLNLKESIALLKESFPYGIHAILATLYLQLDTVFLSYYAGNREVGYYQAAMRIVIGIMIIYEIMVSSYFPVMANKYKHDAQDFARKGNSLNKYMIMIGAVISMCLVLYSDTIVTILYGSGYESTQVILRLLTMVVMLRFVTASYAVILTVADNQKLRAIGVSMSVVVNIALNMVLIPKYGAEGAAVASIITHIFLGVIYIAFAIRLTNNAFIDRNCCKGMILLVAMLPVGLMVKAYQPVLALLPIIVTLIMLPIVAFDHEEKAFLKNLVRKTV